MKLKPNDFRKIVIGSFLAVPALSSLISTIHIVTFFGLGNMSWMAIILALAFEIGSIASLMTLTVLDKINKTAVWFIFFVLVVMQMLGNVYYTYDFISSAMTLNPQWIDSFIDLVEMMTMQKLEERTTKFILSLLIGLPIPVISLAFLKSVSDYLKPDNKENTEKEEKIEIEAKELILSDSKYEEETQENLKIVSAPSSQITDSVTTTENIEEIQDIQDIAVENQELKIIPTEIQDNIVLEEVESPEETSIDDTETIETKEVTEENIEDIIESIEERIEENNIDIYEEKEEEPNESFFDDTTIEEEYDNFQDKEDDEKKSLS